MIVCDECGWEWPLPTVPPPDAECDSCGGDEFHRRDPDEVEPRETPGVS